MHELKKAGKGLFRGVLTALLLFSLCLNTVSGYAMEPGKDTADSETPDDPEQGFVLYAEYTCSCPYDSDMTGDEWANSVDEMIGMIRERLENAGITDYDLYVRGTTGFAVEIRGVAPAGDVREAIAWAEEMKAYKAEAAQAESIEEAGTSDTEDAGENGQEDAAPAESPEDIPDGRPESIEEVHDHSEDEEATEVAADEYHAGMKTIWVELEADGYIAWSDRNDRYDFLPISEDGTVIGGDTDMTRNNAIWKLLALTGKRAVMRFVDDDGYVFMKGDMVESARYVLVTSQYTSNSSNQVEFHLTPEGTKIFGEATRKYIGRTISIWLDSELLVSARVNEAILDGTGLISGSYTQEEAAAVAAKIQSGSLPLKLSLDYVEIREVDMPSS